MTNKIHSENNMWKFWNYQSEAFEFTREQYLEYKETIKEFVKRRKNFVVEGCASYGKNIQYVLKEAKE